MDDKEKTRLMKSAERIVREINPLLQGKGPEVQGAVLADLVSMYFAGHHPMIREQSIEQWLKTMRSLIAPNEAAILELYGVPEGWKSS